jgi:hypothetical protein
MTRISNPEFSHLINKQIKTLAYGIHYHIAAFDQNNDGNPETLLGQAMDREAFWDSRVYRLAYFDKALRLTKRFRSPYSFTVCSSTIGDLTDEDIATFLVCLI